MDFLKYILQNNVETTDDASIKKTRIRPIFINAMQEGEIH